MKREKFLAGTAVVGSPLNLALIPIAVPTIVLVLILLGELSLSTTQLLLLLILAFLISDVLAL